MKRLLIILLTLFSLTASAQTTDTVRLKVHGGIGVGISESKVAQMISDSLSTLDLSGYTKAQVDSIATVIRSEITSGGVTQAQLDDSTAAIRNDFPEGVSWGDITGLLPDQTDLLDSLNNKVNKTDRFSIGVIKPILALNDSTLAFDSLNLTEIRYSQAARDTATWTDSTVIDKKYFLDRLATYSPDGGSTDTSHLSDRIDANAANIATNTTAIAGKQDALTLTTTGTSGAATLSGSTLNIPQYTGSGGSDSSFTDFKDRFYDKDTSQIDIFIIAGQSNASGRGDSSLAPIVDTSEGLKWVPSTNNFAPLRGIIAGRLDSSQTGSAWMSFAKTYYEKTGRLSAYVMTSEGGTGVGDWVDGTYRQDTALSIVNAAIDKAKTQYNKVNVAGVLWDQGERDAILSTQIDVYKARLESVINSYRTNLNLPGLPLFIFELGVDTSGESQSWIDIRTAQNQFANENVFAYMVYTGAKYFKDWGFMNNEFHYTQQGYNAMGEGGAYNVSKYITYTAIQELVKAVGNVSLGDSSFKKITALGLTIPMVENKGLYLSDTTYATSSTLVASPPITFEASGWKTNAPALSQKVKWQIYSVGRSSTTAAASQLIFSANENDGSYIDVMRLYKSLGNNGSLEIPFGSITAAGNITAPFFLGGVTTGNKLISSSWSFRDSSSQDGYSLAAANAATSTSKTIWSPRLHFTAAGWTGSASQKSDFGIEVKPSSGTTPITSYLVFTSAINTTINQATAMPNEILKISDAGKIVQPSTITATGTTGNQTINKPTGKVNIAAAGTSVVVTNSLCTTGSLVFAVIQTNDATAKIANVVPANGSFTINLSAAATSETPIAFWVIN